MSSKDSHGSDKFGGALLLAEREEGAMQCLGRDNVNPVMGSTGLTRS
jgi:hypothetical protein